MTAKSRVILALIVSVCLLSAFSSPVASGSGNTFATVQQSNPDKVVMQVSITESGDARWDILYRFKLTTENETESFNQLSAQIENNKNQYESDFRAQMSSLVQTAENDTQRNMGVDNVSITADVKQLPDDYGVVSYSFTWNGFAKTSNDQLDVDGALTGLFLDSETTMVITWPDKYEIETVSPTPDEQRNGTLIWKGSTQFAPDEPRLVLERTPPSENQPSGGNLPLLLGGVALVAALAVGGYLYRTDTLDDLLSPSETTQPDETETDSESDSSAGDQVETELLSNEEQVINTLEQHGGRMKQQELVDDLGWTEAKTSRVVSDMRDEGSIDGFRLGRENVLELPDQESE